MEDCVIPKDRLLGKEGQGFKIAMKTLDGGRIGIASQALGLAEGAIEETIKYTQERVQFGRRISQFQNTQFQLADMHAKTQAAKWPGVLRGHEEGEPRALQRGRRHGEAGGG